MLISRGPLLPLVPLPKRTPVRFETCVKLIALRNETRHNQKA